jgi:uncharacterized protein with PQ loop repeat
MCPSGAIKWVEVLFGDCIVTSLDKLSFAVGLLSNLVCLTSSLPQIVLNFRHKRVGGQSLFFFAFLFLGSCLSLVGVIVTKGLVTQLLQAVCYVLLDGILLCQFVVYKYIFKTIEPLSTDTPELEPMESPSGPPAPIAIATMLGHAAATDYHAPYAGTQLLGTLFGWVGSAIFIASRIPQIIKNRQTRAVQDLSVLYISMSALGNCTYVVSLLLRSVEGTFLWRQAPFLVGAAGPMACDLILLGQKWTYGRVDPSSNLEEDEKENEISEL